MKSTAAIVSLIISFILVPDVAGQHTGSNPLLPKTKADTLVIVLLGSSTSAGSGASPRDSAWAYKYKAWLLSHEAPVKFVNLAKGGYTTYHVQPDWYTPPANRYTPDSSRNITKALSYHPDAIIINLPTNDAAKSYTIEEQTANFERLANICDSVHVPVWITTTQPRNLSSALKQNLVTMRDWILMRFGENAVDFWNGIADTSGTILPLFDSGDGVHLNNSGHAVLFDRIRMENIPESVRATSVTASAIPFPRTVSVQTYPNPTTGASTFSVFVPKSTELTITISNMLGTIHRVPYTGFISQGRHTITASVADMPPGVYIYHIRAGKEVRYGKLIKLPE